MKRYPKIPRHDLPFVSDQLFSADDLKLLEKTDGMNFRLQLHEDKDEYQYAGAVQETSPPDDTFVIGSKNVIRGPVTATLDSFKSDLQPAVKQIRNLRKPPIRELHKNYGPVVLFAEYMVPHTIDYSYETDPPPLLIGFDVYASSIDSREESDIPGNPYKEGFEGFLSFKESASVFEELGMEVSPVVDKPGTFNADEFTIPRSKYANVKAEGVVIRSDELNERAKYVSQEFEELNRSAMGAPDTDKNKNPIQWIVNSFVTTPRIRKKVQQYTQAEGAEFDTGGDFCETTTDLVLVDVWSEEFVEISKISSKLCPRDVVPAAEDRVKRTLKRMRKMGSRTDKEPQETLDIMGRSRKETSQLRPNIGEQTRNDRIQKSKEIEERFKLRKNRGVNPEKAVIKAVLGGDVVHRTVEEIAEQNNRNIGPWVIGDGQEHLSDKFWTKSPDLLAFAEVTFIPNEIQRACIELIKEDLTARGIEFG